MNAPRRPSFVAGCLSLLFAVLLLTAAVGLAAHAGYGLMALATRSGGNGTADAEAGFAVSAAIAAAGGVLALLIGSLLVAVGSDGVGGDARWKRGLRRTVAALLLPPAALCLVVGGAVAGFTLSTIATRRGATDVDQALRAAGHVPVTAGVLAALLGTLLVLLVWVLLSGTPAPGSDPRVRRTGPASLPVALSTAGAIIVAAALAASAGGSGQLFGVLEPSNYEPNIGPNGTLVLYPTASDTNGDGSADRLFLSTAAGSGVLSAPLAQKPHVYPFPLEPDLTGALRLAGDGSSLTLSVKHLGPGAVRVHALLVSGKVPVLNGTASTASTLLPSTEAQTLTVPLRVEGGSEGLLRGPVTLLLVFEASQPQARVETDLAKAVLTVKLAP